MSLYANNKRMHTAKATTEVSAAAKFNFLQPSCGISPASAERGTKAQNKANGNKKYTYHNGYSNKLWHTLMVAKAKIKKLSGRLAYLKHATTMTAKQPANHNVPNNPTSESNCSKELWLCVNNTPPGPRPKNFSDALCNNTLCDEKLPQPCPIHGLFKNDNQALCHSTWRPLSTGASPPINRPTPVVASAWWNRLTMLSKVNWTIKTKMITKTIIQVVCRHDSPLLHRQIAVNNPNANK